MDIIKKPINSILIIDDDQDDCTFFKEALAEITSTIELAVTHHCDQVISLLDICIPDLIFLDINLPKVDGFDCLKYIQSSAMHCSIPIVMYSSSSSSKELKFACENGSSLFFRKPSRFSDLVESLRGILLMDWDKPAVIKEQQFKDGNYQFYEIVNS